MVYGAGRLVLEALASLKVFASMLAQSCLMLQAPSSDVSVEVCMEGFQEAWSACSWANVGGITSKIIRSQEDVDWGIQAMYSQIGRYPHYHVST